MMPSRFEKFCRLAKPKFHAKIKCGCRFGKGFSATIKRRDGFARRRRGKDDTIVVNLKKASGQRLRNRDKWQIICANARGANGATAA